VNEQTAGDRPAMLPSLEQAAVALYAQPDTRSILKVVRALEPTHGRVSTGCTTSFAAQACSQPAGTANGHTKPPAMYGARPIPREWAADSRSRSRVATRPHPLAMKTRKSSSGVGSAPV
jgi:hypothetical protein